MYGIHHGFRAICLFQQASETELDDRIAKAVTDAIVQAASKSWWERWGVTFSIGILVAVTTIAVGFLGLIDKESPDCTAYANALLTIHKHAANTEAAVAAATHLSWGNQDEHCGSPSDFIYLLRDSEPENPP